MDKMYRQLIRVAYVADNLVYCIFIGWDHKYAKAFHIDNFPKKCHARLKPDYRFMAMVNIGADKIEDIYFENVEIMPQRVPSLKKLVEKSRG